MGLPFFLGGLDRPSVCGCVFTRGRPLDDSCAHPRVPEWVMSYLLYVWCTLRLALDWIRWCLRVLRVSWLLAILDRWLLAVSGLVSGIRLLLVRRSTSYWCAPRHPTFRGSSARECGPQRCGCETLSLGGRRNLRTAREGMCLPLVGK